jgi:hypothetical protein
MKSVLWVSVAIALVLLPPRSARSVPPAYDDYRAALLGFVDTNGLVDYAGLSNSARTSTIS